MPGFTYAVLDGISVLAFFPPDLTFQIVTAFEFNVGISPFVLSAGGEFLWRPLVAKQVKEAQGDVIGACS